MALSKILNGYDRTGLICLFDGAAAGPITPIVDFNVTNITDIGTGNYTINFTKDFTSVDYVITGRFRRSLTDSNAFFTIDRLVNPAVSNMTCYSKESGGVAVDGWGNVVLFGDLVP